METILTILLVVGGILYKVYENYKEEMEKSKKRLEKLRQPSPVPQQAIPAKKTVERTRIQEIEPINMPTHSIPTGEIYKIEAQQAMNEVEYAHKQRAERQLRQKKVQLQDEANYETLEHSKFDLRRAIIQQAILERPYKD
ncbi:hypothetical protein GQF61_05940 [Sphingobacterium sp. DK4209]|uniref:Uncharacterized protein n=1 Tax=Sphingobacterium zhuxiongii TaxID=2662364 RepID=A0A5Q0QBD1_9SPHI|nr:MULTISPECIES: hypothetical protein [unclassified Sphingobacterium]MVZ65389.1 hypothetical protein [Sphingobacterium sp. DK4209]QGA27457.1 hypothetical protein GFH32_14540 [Sphingobacterium sp. dk4302]